MEKLRIMPNETTGRGGAFAAVLRQYRRGARLSQSALADVIEVDHSYVSRLEAGKRIPSMEMVAKLADALEMDAIDRAKLLLAAGFTVEEFAPLRATLSRLALVMDRPEALDIIDLCCHPDMSRPMLQAIRHLLHTMVMQARAESEAAA